MSSPYQSSPCYVYDSVSKDFNKTRWSNILGTCMKLVTPVSHTFSCVFLMLHQILSRFTKTGIDTSCNNLDSVSRSSICCIKTFGSNPFTLKVTPIILGFIPVCLLSYFLFCQALCLQKISLPAILY